MASRFNSGNFNDFNGNQDKALRFDGAVLDIGAESRAKLSKFGAN